MRFSGAGKINKSRTGIKIAGQTAMKTWQQSKEDCNFAADL